MTDINKANQLLREVMELATGHLSVNDFDREYVKVGLDLGTSSIVLVVVDKNNRPIFAAYEDADVVRDGLVVNYIEATRISKRLKDLAEETLGIPLLQAAGAIPPGTIGNNKNVVKNVIESTGMECVAIVDEPTAASAVLKVENGAIVDVGGGTTGISIFRNGEVVYSADEPTGGTQMTLVLSGYLHVPIVEGEQIKRDPSRQVENFQIMKPVAEKMATITGNFIKEYGSPVNHLYLVGGATSFPDFPKVFEKLLSIPVIQPEFPQFVTPLGIAMGME